MWGRRTDRRCFRILYKKAMQYPNHCGLPYLVASSKDIKGTIFPSKVFKSSLLGRYSKIAKPFLSFFLTYASLLGIIFFVEPCTEELTFKACESTMSFEQSYRLQGMACILVHHFEFHGVKYLTWLGLNYAD